MSISAAGPFDGVGVDVIKFHCSSRGRRYIVVFIDYLTKWPDVFATASVTVAELLMEHISRHRVTSELLSHWDTDSLSKLMLDVYKNGDSQDQYHCIPSANRCSTCEIPSSLTDMLAMTIVQGSNDWDQHLPYVLFVYSSSCTKFYG